MTCLDPRYRIVVQCQKAYVLNKHEIEQTKLRVLERLTDGSDHNNNYTQSNIIEELSQLKADEIVLNKKY